MDMYLENYGNFCFTAVEEKSNIGGIAGGVAGAVSAVIVVVVIAFIMYRRRRPKAQR